MLCNDPYIKKEIIIEMGKVFELNDIKTTTHQNILAAPKAVISLTVMTYNKYVEKDKRLKINMLIIHLMQYPSHETSQFIPWG